jgi:hypothetical protein
MTGKEAMQISPPSVDWRENDTETAKLPQSDASFASEMMQ